MKPKLKTLFDADKQSESENSMHIKLATSNQGLSLNKNIYILYPIAQYVRCLSSAARG